MFAVEWVFNSCSICASLLKDLYEMLFQEKPIFSLRIYSFSFISTDKGRKKYDIMPMCPSSFAYAFAYFRSYRSTPSPSFVRTYTATATHLYQPQPTPVHQLMRASTAIAAHHTPAFAYMRPSVSIYAYPHQRTCAYTLAYLCPTVGHLRLRICVYVSPR